MFMSNDRITRTKVYMHVPARLVWCSKVIYIHACIQLSRTIEVYNNIVCIHCSVKNWDASVAILTNVGPEK